jgi:hypothetical protein
MMNWLQDEKLPDHAALAEMHFRCVMQSMGDLLA